MSTDRDTTRIVRSWLQTDEYESADRVLDAVLDQLDTTPQRRSTWWPARRLPQMNTTAKLGIVAAAVVVAAFLGIRFLLPGPNIGTDGPTPTVAPSPAALHSGTLTAGTYVMTPFTGVGASGICVPEAPECVEDPRDDSYSLTFTVPDGYAAASDGHPLIFGHDGDTIMTILRGADLYSDPCHSDPSPGHRGRAICRRLRRRDRESSASRRDGSRRRRPRGLLRKVHRSPTACGHERMYARRPVLAV